MKTEMEYIQEHGTSFHQKGAKVGIDDAVTIYNLYMKEGKTQKEIASQYDISQQRVSQIINGNGRRIALEMAGILPKKENPNVDTGTEPGQLPTLGV